MRPSSPTGITPPPRHSKPRITLAVKRVKGAPRQPANAALKAALLRALGCVPVERCPEAFECTRLSLDIQLITDAEMAALNAKHMNHKGPTDVLSFPICGRDFERDSFHVGDVIVSFETAQREAADRNISVDEEIMRYCVHGFLHCLGYDDSTPAKRRAMFAVQEKSVKPS